MRPCQSTFAFPLAYKSCHHSLPLPSPPDVAIREHQHEDVLKKIQETNNCDSVSEAVRVLLHHVQAGVSEAILFGLVRCKRPLNCTSCPAHAAAAAAKAAPSAAPAAAE
ncbi:unnamed protein product [Closterium sp. NIES-53]